jgi:hypothetical protein
MCLGDEKSEKDSNVKAGASSTIRSWAAIFARIFVAGVLVMIVEQRCSGMRSFMLILCALAVIYTELFPQLRPLLVRDDLAKSALEGGEVRSSEADAIFSGDVSKSAEVEAVHSDPLRYGFLPSMGRPIAHANVRHVETMENDLCIVKLHAMHRPTHEPSREATGDYPFAWHLLGRKRLWEIRMQIRFKRIPTGRMYFGCTLGHYIPVSAASRQVSKTLANICTKIIGDVYNSPGDDPSTIVGEAEPPTFVMPLWAFDQFIVSESGDEPDLLGNLENLGYRRTDGLREYVSAMKDVTENLSTEKVYTLCSYGVSQFIDCIRWETCSVFPWLRTDMRNMCGKSPIYVSLYELPKEDGFGEDRRHLQSRKRTYVEVAMWSENKPPAQDVIERLFGPAVSRNADPTSKAAAVQSASALDCCTRRGK